MADGQFPSTRSPSPAVGTVGFASRGLGEGDEHEPCHADAGRAWLCWRGRSGLFVEPVAHQATNCLGTGQTVASPIDPGVEAREIRRWKTDCDLRRINPWASTPFFSRIRYCIGHELPILEKAARHKVAASRRA